MPARGSKRRRTPDDIGNASSGNDRHQVFTKWAKDQGVEINGVAAQDIPQRGAGLVTTKPLKEGDRILFIPEKAMFKPDAPWLKREKLDDASPQAQLAVSAMWAFRDHWKNERTDLKVWKDVWPTSSDFVQSMPMCWSEETQTMLPSSAQQPLERQLSDFTTDWRACARFSEGYDFEHDVFRYYWMIVNSRSFHWKPPRGKAGSMVMCPFIDYLNHGPTGSTCHVKQTAKGYEVTANRDYGECKISYIHHAMFQASPLCMWSIISCLRDVMEDTPDSTNNLQPSEASGEEILATYGSHSNDKLLVHYGFVLPDIRGPDDEIRLDDALIPCLEPEVRSQLQDVGFLGGYALSPVTGEICFRTEVAVRANTQTANEWEYYIANGEDLSGDYSTEVKELLKLRFSDYRWEIVTVKRNIKGIPENEDTAKSVLLLRWTQILDAIDRYTGEIDLWPIDRQADVCRPTEQRWH